jgi:hypothetical protein
MARWVLTPTVQSCDGVRLIFNSPTGYFPGSIRVWLNGLKLPEDASPPCWVELGAGKVRMEEAPKVGDTLEFGYQPL